MDTLEGSVARLPMAPAAGRLARQHVRALTGGDVDSRVALVVTELVTNAVLHARSAPILTVAVGPSAIRVEVFDDGPGTPRLRPLGDEPVTSGRGLALVDMVAESWGVAPSGPGGAPGKTVWAVIAAG